jgi:hypothetical protein
MRELLEELEARLRAFGAPIAGAFLPGASPERVRSALEAEGVSAHEDLVAWWSWHDGAAIDDGPGHLLPRREHAARAVAHAVAG